MYQDFESEAQEYAFVVSDNEIQKWASTDLSMVNNELIELGDNFLDFELFGFKSFEPLKDVFFDEGNIDDQGKLDEKKMTKCPNCGEEFDHAKNQA